MLKTTPAETKNQTATRTPAVTSLPSKTTKPVKLEKELIKKAIPATNKNVPVITNALLGKAIIIREKTALYLFPTVKRNIYIYDYINITMIEVKAQLKRWGRSFGIIVPMEKIKENSLSENDLLDVIISKEENPLKKHFGTFKFKKSTKELLKESDKEGWDE